MATNTYVALDKITVGTATATVTFSSIPATYTDLVIVANFTVATASANLVMTFNGDTTSGLYSKTQLEGTGTSVFSGRTANGNNIGLDSNIGNDTTSPSIQIIQLMNYANTSVFKTVLARQGGYWSANPGVSARVGLWRNTNAITSVTLTNGAVNFSVGSTFSLYGIAASSVGAKATGGTIYSDSQYFYHAFAANGTFTPTQSISADVLVVAGGGGASNGAGGGGGAGGLLPFTSQSLTATAYSISVGSGGAINTNGNDSQFGSLTLVKGGGLGGGTTGGTGGSGGGGGGGSGTSGGAATSGQGNAGGAGANLAFPNDAAGGGGGKGAAGATGTSATGGAGGIGSSDYSSWGSVTGIGQNVSGTYYYAGGGGGYGRTTSGAGGLGGGGACNTTTGGTAGAANTGGGGGAFQDAGGSSLGGSGVVIVRYAK